MDMHDNIAHVIVRFKCYIDKRRNTADQPFGQMV